MESHQPFGYGVTGAGFPYSSSYTSTSSPSIPNRLLGTLKFDIGNSPNSPFSTSFDCDPITPLSDSLEHLSSTENLSGLSPSCNSSLESSPYFHRFGGPSPDSLVPYSGGSTHPQNANCSPSMKHVLQELETVLMEPNEDYKGAASNASTSIRMQTSGQKSRAWGQERQDTRVIQSNPSSSSSHRQSSESAQIENRQRLIEELSLHSSPPSNLKQLLIECAKALSENNINDFDNLIEKARAAVSISGEPIQRLGAYLVEGLVARKEKSGSSIYRGLRCREPEGRDLLSYMHILYEICPYLKFGYMAANGAIAEACRNENRIHIIDFQIAQGTQWITLLQALAAKPSGAPHVRITGIDDPLNHYARGDGLEAVGRRLADISKKFNIPLEFHPVPVFDPNVTMDMPDVRPEEALAVMLDVRPGEALAVNFPLQLHHTPDESVDVNNPRDGLLRMVKSLNPKVVTLVEQESNTNTAAFLRRFTETLNYYLAMFESIDVTMPREQKERINVEQHCLARDIVNVIACEGKDRVERHELFSKWKSRFMMAGFRQCSLSNYVNSVIKSLLRCYSEHYTLVEKDGAMLLGWKDRDLISASAWH